MPGKRVLSIGQCAADHWMIARTLSDYFDADVVSADEAAEALMLLRREAFDLILVNRRLDVDGSSGLDIIKQIKAEAALGTVPVMLVSNFGEAQQEAIKAGAERGFGKAALGRSDMLERVRRFLNQSEK